MIILELLTEAAKKHRVFRNGLSYFGSLGLSFVLQMRHEHVFSVGDLLFLPLEWISNLEAGVHVVVTVLR